MSDQAWQDYLAGDRISAEEAGAAIEREVEEGIDAFERGEIEALTTEQFFRFGSR